MEAGDNTSYTAGMREAALHATVGRHNNIVGLLDAFEHRNSSGRHPVMVLQPCGATLLNVSEHRGRTCRVLVVSLTDYDNQ